MKYSLDKYKYYQYKNEKGGTTVSAVSSYGGRTVKGYAKCNPEDSFDIETGKELAAARCNERISAKRLLRATDKYLEAANAVKEAQLRMQKMTAYYTDAVDQHDEAVEHLNKVVSKIHNAE